MKALFAALSLLTLTSVAMAQEKQEETIVEVLGQSDAVVLKKTGADNADPVKNVRVNVKITGDAQDKQDKTVEKKTSQRTLYSDGKLNGYKIQNNMQYRIYQLPDRQYIPNSNAITSLNVDSFNSSSDASKIFIEIDLNNSPLKEALKTVFRKANREFEVQADVEREVRVTLKAKKMRLSTVMSAISDQTGLNWEKTSEVMGDSKTMKTKYRLGKKSIAPFTWPNIQYGNSPNSLNAIPKPVIQIYKFNSTRNKAEYLDSNANSLSGTVVQDGHALIPGVPVLGTIFKNSNDRFSNALTYSLSTQETRSTFTCPHCQKQVTIVSQKQSLKCPDCKREFLSDWKFCPFDGAKRPASGIEWGFCPICGKDLPHKEGSESAKR